MLDGAATIPDDYVAFLNSEPYVGVPSDLDGMKIRVALALAFAIK